MAADYTSVVRRPKPSRGPALEKGAKVLVVGNGVVGCKFCEALVHEGLRERFQITVIGAEPRPAYDRIKLSSWVDHRRIRECPCPRSSHEGGARNSGNERGS